MLANRARSRRETDLEVLLLGVEAYWSLHRLLLFQYIRGKDPRKDFILYDRLTLW
jgi:hypothetical protein